MGSRVWYCLAGWWWGPSSGGGGSTANLDATQMRLLVATAAEDFGERSAKKRLSADTFVQIFESCDRILVKLWPDFGQIWPFLVGGNCGTLKMLCCDAIGAGALRVRPSYRVDSGSPGGDLRASQASAVLASDANFASTTHPYSFFTCTFLSHTSIPWYALTRSSGGL